MEQTGKQPPLHGWPPPFMATEIGAGQRGVLCPINLGCQVSSSAEEVRQWRGLNAMGLWSRSPGQLPPDNVSAIHKHHAEIPHFRQLPHMRVSEQSSLCSQ